MSKYFILEVRGGIFNMKEFFSTYYAPEEEEFKKLWNESIFVFDANVLLNLYRYSIDTTEIFLDIITRLSDRVWVPHQVALEYHANRTSVIYEQIEAYTRVRQIISKASTEFFSRLDDDLKSYKRRHPVIDISTITSRLEGYIRTINEELERQEENHPTYLLDDSIRRKLELILSGKIGSPFNDVELKQVFEEGEKRYKQKRPPGYKDAVDKKDKVKYYRGLVIEDQYGDLIVWKQLLKKATDEQKSIIFITDDAKEDWWQRVHGKIIGPRFELIDEFTNVTNQRFYMYESYRFIEYAQSFLNQQVDKKAINEVQQLKQSKESEFEENIFKELKQYNKLLSRGKLNSRIKRPIVNYTVGEKVIHSKWGVGIIVSKIGIGRSQEISITFPTPVGTKRLLAYLAPLQKFTPYTNTEDIMFVIDKYDEEYDLPDPDDYEVEEQHDDEDH